MAHEIELKLQVPEAAVRAVAAAVERGQAQTTRLQAIYFDTPDRRLAAAGIALRLRKEGRRWVQTLKAGGPNAMQRLEHNVELTALGAGRSLQPAIDLQRHAGTPAAALLAAALGSPAGQAWPALAALYRTDIRRRHRALRTRGGSVELAFDRGEILADDRRLPVCELEIELMQGDPRLVIDVASRWAARHGLWLDVRSKAERGDRLARAQVIGPVRKAGPLAVERKATPDDALRVVVASCLDQILPNASEVGSGAFAAEHVHQLRVGLRRLRTALRFFDGWAAPVPPEWAQNLRRVFTQLGVTRDRDALAATLLPALRQAGAPRVDLPPPDQAVDPAALARDPAFTQTLLQLLALAAGAPDGVQLGARFVDGAAERLERWHRRVRRGAREFAELDDDARHRLRRRLKRLRYGVDFTASLHRRGAVARYAARLQAAQDSLGRYNDLGVALGLFRTLAAEDASAWFAVGWLSARREAALADCVAALQAFARAKPFWRAHGTAR